MISVISFWISLTIIVAPMALTLAVWVILAIGSYIGYLSRGRASNALCDYTDDILDNHSGILEPILFIMSLIDALIILVSLVAYCSGAPASSIGLICVGTVTQFALGLSKILPYVAAAAVVIWLFTSGVRKISDIYYTIKEVIFNDKRN